MLVDAKHSLRLCDFGFTGVTGPILIEELDLTRGAGGRTVWYSAPELFDMGPVNSGTTQPSYHSDACLIPCHAIYNTRRSDIFALGVSPYEVLFILLRSRCTQLN